MKLPTNIIKLKIKFLNFLDFLIHNEDFEKGKLTRLDQDSRECKEWMRNDWELRAKKNPFYFIRTEKNQSDEEFWRSGYRDRDSILEHKSIKEKLDEKFDEFKVLEIGCGIGRILIPMSEKFQEVIGIDISQEMVNIGKQKTKSIPNCKILLNNGIDLSSLSSDYFDFCYSFIVFQHIPEKKIVKNYIKEVARVLKPNSYFRFQVRGTITTKPNQINTWDGVQFSSQEIHEFADDFGFRVIAESGESTEYYWITFCLK